MRVFVFVGNKRIKRLFTYIVITKIQIFNPDDIKVDSFDIVNPYNCFTVSVVFE